MNTTLTQKLLAVLLCSGLLAAGGAAEARGGDDREYRGRGWDDRKHEHRHRHRDRDHYRGYGDSRTIIRERVIVREVPRRYREREVREYYYEQPYPAYGYSRSPAVVIGVNIPPLIFPLR